MLAVTNHAVQRPPQPEIVSDAPRDLPPTGLSPRSLKQAIKLFTYTEDLQDTWVLFIHFMKEGRKSSAEDPKSRIRHIFVKQLLS